MLRTANRRNSLACLVTVLATGGAQAADPYQPGMTYVANDQVCYQGDLYQAKWWAGAQDLPSDVDLVAEPWDTPWQRLTAEAAECGTTDPMNHAPSVSVSANPSAPDATGQIPVTLYADASDADGDALSFAWTQVSGEAPSVAILDADQPEAMVILPQANQVLSYEFQVRVSDGQTTVSKVVAFELVPEIGNQAPVAVVSSDPASVVGAAVVQLIGDQSSDSDGDLLTCQWQQLAPAMPLAAFDDTQACNPLVDLPQPDATTTFVFQLQVSDGELADTGEVQVTQYLEGEATACPSWLASEVYTQGDLVDYAGSRWEAQWWTQGEQPGTTGEWGVWRSASTQGECVAVVDPDPNPEPTPNPGGGEVIKLSELNAAEAALTDTPQMAAVKASIATADNAVVEAIEPGLASNPGNVQRVEGIVSEADWEYLFPRRAPAYTYRHFLQAIGKFPAFCGDYEDGREADAICSKALATMFAHFTQETGGHTDAWPEPQWRQGLVYVRELGWSEDMPNGYGICDSSTWQGQSWPCAVFEDDHPNAGQFKSYFGRGAKQLSYNYNYGPFSQAMFGDVGVLLEQPNLVADTWLNLVSAVFFYVYPQPPKPSMLHALDGTWQPNEHDLEGGLVPGFGVTTQIINGGIECGGPTEHRQSQNRIDYYQNFAAYLGVPVPAKEVLGCANMARFDTQGTGALNIYWEQAWSGSPSCQLVNYQTAYSAFIEGDYAACVDHYFDVTIDYDN